MKLYGFWRSNATFRVRIALNLKGLPVDDNFIDLDAGDQFDADYAAKNPQNVVPTLELDDGGLLFQSLAICEYLDEAHPEPPLLPKDLNARARVRGLALIPSADAHPMIVPRIRNYLAGPLGHDQDEVMAWVRHWMTAGLGALEARLAGHPATGRFCHGDQPTLADVCLAPQVAATRLFGGDTGAYPTCEQIFDRCMALDAFASAHPTKQPDFPG